jgi:DNA-directed RNA polymerase specialized sigma24 family protein
MSNTSPANWAFRIARNAIIDEYRRAGRGREQLMASVHEQSAPPDEDEPGPTASAMPISQIQASARTPAAG